MTCATSSQQFLVSLSKALASYHVDTPLDLAGRNGRILLVGNGGSAAIASHIANDLVKAERAAAALVDPAILTCLANDYGYDEAFAHQVRVQGRSGDLLVAISSSGRSLNIRNAVYAARKSGLAVATLSGFAPENPLRTMGDHNYWVDSSNYGVVECAHLAILHSIAKPT